MELSESCWIQVTYMLMANYHIFCFIAVLDAGTYIPHNTFRFHVSSLHRSSGQLPDQWEMLTGQRIIQYAISWYA